MATLGDRIKQRMEELGIESLAQVSRDAGDNVSRSRLSQIVGSATAELSYGNMVAVANALKVHPDWLAFGTPPKLIAETKAPIGKIAPETPPARMGDRILQMAAARGFQREDLSRLLGVPKDAIKTLVEGHETTTLVLEQICRKFGVTADYVLFGNAMGLDRQASEVMVLLNDIREKLPTGKRLAEPVASLKRTGSKAKTLKTKAE